MKNVLNSRISILIAITVFIFSIFTIKLIQLQIIDGDEYFEQSNSVIMINQTVNAARGDIVDINGEYMATSHPVFNIVLNKVYIDDEDTNEKIYEVLQILLEQDEMINDILPISVSQPYTFYENADSEITRVRDFLSLNVYSTEENIMDKLVEKYKLEDYTKEYQRLIAGVRYTMEREGYSQSYPFNLAKDVSLETASIISELSSTLLGAEVIQYSDRYYENGSLLPHILGTVGPIYAEEYQVLKEQGYGLNDTIGKNGLELVYESYLKGSDGVIQLEKDEIGGILSETELIQPQPGHTLSLTIDAELQEAVNEIAKLQIEDLQSREAGWGKETSGVAIVVLDTKTGGILAASNYPSYDLNYYTQNYTEYVTNPDTPLFNRVFQGTYRPGSVFKMVVATAGLQEGLITPDTVHYCSGVYTHYTLEEWGGSSLPGCAGRVAHGYITVEEALQVSCNTFFYDLGRRLGVDVINEYAMQYGFGQTTGVEVAESQGSLSSPEAREEMGLVWNEGDVIQMSIGQLDTTVTALQLASYANTIANDGVRYQTHIVDSILSYDYKDVIYETPITIMDEIKDNGATFDAIEDGMVLASTEGSANMYLQDLPYTIASKTGTAQVPGDLYNATLVAYGPVENPEITIAVIGEKAGNGYNLAFSVREIFLKYYEIKEARANLD